MKQSAGTLLFRHGPVGLEVLLVHPGGNYNRKAPWSIPKGEPNDGEADLEVVARRETLEETGIQAGELVALGDMTYRKNRKRVVCFAGPAPAAAEAKPNSWEVDKAEFMPVGRARELLHPDQCVFLDRLQDYLAQSG
jgi:predicted NUDIX family NTP pyrophosphohydrolase